MFNPVQMWNYGALFNKLGLSEKGRLYNQFSFVQVLLNSGIEEGV